LRWSLGSDPSSTRRLEALAAADVVFVGADVDLCAAAGRLGLAVARLDQAQLTAIVTPDAMIGVARLSACLRCEGSRR
jgi:tRNA1(Val) A37 N6-methylase TrmN6